MVPSSGIRRAKSIIVPTAQGLRGYQLSTGYALRLRLKPKRLGIGWRGIVRKSSAQRSRLPPHGQCTTAPLALGLLWTLDGLYFNILFIHSPIKRLSTTDVFADETFWIFVPQSEDVLLGFLFVPCCNICNMDTHGGPRTQNDVIVSHTVSTRV